MTAQISLVQHDHAIEALAANGADHPFNIRTLPRRARRRQYLLDAHGLNLVDEALPEDLVAVAQEITRRSVPGEGFSYLLRSPFRCGMIGHAEMENASPVVGRHEEHIKDLEADRRNGEKVD